MEHGTIGKIIIKGVNMMEQGMDEDSVLSNVTTLSQRAKLDEDAPRYIMIAVKRMVQMRKKDLSRERNREPEENDPI